MPDVLPGCALMASRGKRQAFLAEAAQLTAQSGCRSPIAIQGTVCMHSEGILHGTAPRNLKSEG